AIPATVPWKPASPNEKTPPSAATIQYPLPDGVAAMPTTGLARATPVRSPKKAALPFGYTWPAESAIQYPEPVGVGATPTRAISVHWLVQLGPIWSKWTAVNVIPLYATVICVPLMLTLEVNSCA